jgi:hypothetical protein
MDHASSKKGQHETVRSNSKCGRLGGERGEKTRAKANSKRGFQLHIGPQNEPKIALKRHHFWASKWWQKGLKSLKLKFGVDLGFNFDDFTVQNAQNTALTSVLTSGLLYPKLKSWARAIRR